MVAWIGRSSRQCTLCRIATPTPSATRQACSPCRFYRAKDDEIGWEPRKLYNIVDFMMVDKDCSGSIDVDECMEILYRRFGKEGLEQKTAEFMALDTDDDDEQSIGFAEYMVGINRISQIPDPGFKISQGMVSTTKEEIRKLMQDINGTSVARKLPPRRSENTLAERSTRAAQEVGSPVPLK